MKLYDDFVDLEENVDSLVDYLGNTDYQELYHKAQSIQQELEDLRQEYGKELVQ